MIEIDYKVNGRHIRGEAKLIGDHWKVRAIDMADTDKQWEYSRESDPLYALKAAIRQVNSL